MALSTLLLVGSTVLGAYGQIAAGQAANDSAKYNAQVQRQNAKIADQAARDSIERGKLEEQQKRKETAALQGKQAAQMAASGLDLSFGSPLDTLVDTAKQGEIDALTIRTNTYREAYNHKVEATNFRNQANLGLVEGKNAQTAGYIGAAGTILAGGSKAFAKKGTDI